MHGDHVGGGTLNMAEITK